MLVSLNKLFKNNDQTYTNNNHMIKIFFQVEFRSSSISNLRVCWQNLANFKFTILKRCMNYIYLSVFSQKTAYFTYNLSIVLFLLGYMNEMLKNPTNMRILMLDNSGSNYLMVFRLFASLGGFDSDTFSKKNFNFAGIDIAFVIISQDLLQLLRSCIKNYYYYLYHNREQKHYYRNTKPGGRYLTIIYRIRDFILSDPKFISSALYIQLRVPTPNQTQE